MTNVKNKYIGKPQNCWEAIFKQPQNGNENDIFDLSTKCKEHCDTTAEVAQ